MIKANQFGCRCSNEQSEQIKLYVSKCKTKYNERASDVLVKALKLYYEKLKGSEKIGS
ncbi:MAG: hypothetical protein ACRC5T_08595 [Cetobacterium sp.]